MEGWERVDASGSTIFSHPGSVTRDLTAFQWQDCTQTTVPRSLSWHSGLSGRWQKAADGRLWPRKEHRSSYQWQSYWSHVCTGNIMDTDLLSGWSEDSGGSFHFTRLLLNEKWKWNIFICSLFCFIIYCKPPPAPAPDPGSMVGRSLCPVSYFSQCFQGITLQGCFYQIILTRSK